MRSLRLAVTLFPVLVFAGLSGCSSVSYHKDDYRIENGVLMKGDNDFTMRAIHVPGLGATGGVLSEMVPALAEIAANGGNAVAFDLSGISEDGARIDMAAAETVSAIAERVKGQNMYAVVRIVTPEESPEYRAAAVATAAAALKDEGRVVYWIDAPDSAALVEAFKSHAKGRVVAAASGGDIVVLSEAPGEAPGQPVMLVGGVLPDLEDTDTHFVLPPGAASYAALEEASLTEAEKQGWTPDNAVLSEEEREEGFIALFNGRDLSGWWFSGDNENGFEVRDGAIEWVESGARSIKTVNRYDNFILRLEYRIEDGGNSGIFLRAPRASRESKIGMEFQIRGDHGVEPTNDQTGAIYMVAVPLVNASNPSPEWNEVEIMLDGPKLRAVLNGQLIQDIDLDEDEELRYRLRRGFIGLQDHSDYVAFRNVRIKPL